MSIQNHRRLSALFAILLVSGIAQVSIGLVAIPMRPYHQLDVVLSVDELKDDETKEQTLELLKKAAGIEWLFWVAFGGFTAAVSGLGLAATRNTRPATH
jgi:hypothetical protein